MKTSAAARRVLPWLSLALVLCLQPAAAAEPATPTAPPAKSAKAAAKPGDKGAAAGIIVLDGKAPPAAGVKGQAATGIGAGGCAACDKTEPATKPAAKAAQAAPTK